MQQEEANTLAMSFNPYTDRLARRAENHLRNGSNCLEFIANLDQLIEALANPTEAAPTLLALG